MIKQALNEGWTLHISGERDTLPANVPGSYYADLLRAGYIKDPFYRDNEGEALRWTEQNMTYTCRFTPDDGLLDCPELILRFEGISAIADITVNNTPLGHTENMHRVWEYDVTNLVHNGVNTLKVELKPSAGAQKYSRGPGLPDGGIWRPVTLLGVEGARIGDVRVSQEHTGGRVELRMGLSLYGNADVSAALTDPQGNVTEFPKLPMLMTIDHPQLWWPRGYGEQPLYTVRVEAKADGKTVDIWERRIGLRTATMSIEKDDYGESFAHEINGVKIFAMGADYVPEDSILSRVTPERTRRLLEDAALANFNCIRVWGGGYYPDDFFYDICDELGLLVWQDFMFDRADYGLTRDFAENIRAEVRDNVTRLRHHPCIALWCGNNEMELLAAMGRATPRQKADYIRLFEYIIPTELKKHAPDAFYWPSSPSSGGGFDEPDSLDHGDAHPKCSDTRAPGRYVSDFGTPSCPCLPTVESFTLPDERNLFSRAMEEHSGTPRHTAHIMSNIHRHYLCPTSFDTTVYASQLAQAEILRSAAQHYRRYRGRCMGALFRQLNDRRPEISCSSIDYTGRWKALHYFAKRFFSPLLLSCKEQGMQDITDGPHAVEKSVRFCVTNETRRPRSVLVKWALRDRLSRVKREETISLTVPPLQSAWLDKVMLPEADIFHDFVSYTLYEMGAPVSFDTVLFTQPKYYEFLDPRLECRLDGSEIIVTSKAYAQNVEIQNAGEDLVLSDNYFDMLPGERRIKIVRGRPESLKVRSVFDIK